MSLNSITVSGTLKEAPEKRFTPSNIPVTNMLLEVSYIPRGTQMSSEKTAGHIIRVNAWRDLAEECEKKLKAGDKVLIIGRAQINAYTNNEGKKKREVEIDANSITLIEDVLSVKAPPSTVKTDTNTSKKENQTEGFKKTVGDVESGVTEPRLQTNIDEMINTEEIPF
ncbi:MAG: hypothetical protein A3B68_06900 [Candidatus Melainabacteria bacterium RIFCSPHIGHO2_02_FULL_34_12]|nr:MAG: hypothetical protein A3B68_06900 [Candidatus Melainabacteria bacterium RIFCSPHIGHO2_02_FULL_34_12]